MLANKLVRIRKEGVPLRNLEYLQGSETIEMSQTAKQLNQTEPLIILNLMESKI